MAIAINIIAMLNTVLASTIDPLRGRVVCLTHGGRRKTPFALNAAIRRWRKFVGTFVNQMRFRTAPRSAASRCPVAALAFASP
jgi:hypothetical protein